MAKRIVVAPELEAIVAAFGSYQLKQRRLAPLTVHMDSYGIRAFLAWRTSEGLGGLDELTPEELVDFVVAESARLAPRTVGTYVGALRGFVRFLYASGVTAADLSGALPSVAAVRFSGLAKAVDPATVTALLGSCDRTRPSGRRDYAILVLMARLGLRAIEIARMGLDDIDWRAGEMTVHGKGGRTDRLPIPVDVGDALVDYLRHGRRETASRAVFIQAIGPATAMSRNAVVFVSRTASARAGLATVAGHRLRHTAATGMLAAGASMREVGQVLRHDDDTTTAIYAKADRASLSRLARPWPGTRP
jgi:integrase/recombinase XerD